MKQKYEVIWIDDEWDKMTQFKEECEVIHNIYLHPFKTRKAGMEALDGNLSRWDAVVLDAKMFDQSEVNETTNLVGLRKAIEHLNQLPASRRIPYFISTGQPDLMDNEVFEQSFGKFYIKGNDDPKLIEDIKDKVNRSTRFQIKALYPEAIECLSSLNNNAKEFVVDILEAMHYPETHPDFNPVLYYNQLRQILEWNFRYAIKYGIIPEDCIENKGVNLNQCCCYLSGKDCDIIHKRYGVYRNRNDYDRIVPQHIENMMFLVLNLGNINSHTSELKEMEKQELDTFFRKDVNNSRYTIYSLALQICEISMWFYQYVEGHSDIEKNKKMCRTLETKIPSSDDSAHETTDGKDLIGVVECHNGIYHIGKDFYIREKTALQMNCINKKVKVTGYDENTNPDTSNKYPLFAYRVEVLD